MWLSEGNHWITFRWLQFVCLAVAKIIPKGIHFITLQRTFLFRLNWCSAVLSSLGNRSRYMQVCTQHHRVQSDTIWLIKFQELHTSQRTLLKIYPIALYWVSMAAILVRQFKILGKFLWEEGKIPIKMSSNVFKIGKKLQSLPSHQNEQDISEDVGSAVREKLVQWAQTEIEDSCEHQDMLFFLYECDRG